VHTYCKWKSDWFCCHTINLCKDWISRTSILLLVCTLHVQDEEHERVEVLAAPGQQTGLRVDNDKRTTTPYMTKYERARVLGTRALQIASVVALYLWRIKQPCHWQRWPLSARQAATVHTSSHNTSVVVFSSKFVIKSSLEIRPDPKCIAILDTHTHTQLLYGPFSWTFRVVFWTLWCKGRYQRQTTNNPAGRQSSRTNQRPSSLFPPFLRQMSFLPQPSQFILAWDRHQICWLAYPVAWLLHYTLWDIFHMTNSGQ